ncbi:hypothetical protein MCAG_01750 [Micromonospora sp. ATCC 39149]|uniref:ATP synthase protein I n=1 Tax=Micromonospora carbonacea TaxID=47853 RepID=A0A7D6CD79_9ACTN|nr:hypothetical protein [Micromonospora sp. ATCC 39149]EEP71423.1 hypothetical protein MCAG_01750 [Micromonospora sp. ATCC 39149]QLJ97690.1 hypothetical protein HZU44_23380 [Micromonospora carbonacea]
MAEPVVDAARATDDRGWRLRHLPVLLAASAAVAALGAVVGGVLGGADAALGVAAGVAVTVASYVLTTVVLAWADARNPQLVLPFGVGLYVAKFTLLGGVLMAVASTGWSAMVPLCIGIAVGVVVWTGAHIWWLSTVYARRAKG